MANEVYIWNRVRLKMVIEEVLDLDVKVPFDEGATAEELQAAAEAVVRERQAEWWNDPAFVSKTNIIFSRPQHNEWYLPNDNGQPDYNQPLHILTNTVSVD